MGHGNGFSRFLKPLSFLSASAQSSITDASRAKHSRVSAQIAANHVHTPLVEIRLESGNRQQDVTPSTRKLILRQSLQSVGAKTDTRYNISDVHCNDAQCPPPGRDCDFSSRFRSRH